jgi:hypothetical protein
MPDKPILDAKADKIRKLIQTANMCNVMCATCAGWTTPGSRPESGDGYGEMLARLHDSYPILPSSSPNRAQ